MCTPQEDEIHFSRSIIALHFTIFNSFPFSILLLFSDIFHFFNFFLLFFSTQVPSVTSINSLILFQNNIMKTKERLRVISSIAKRGKVRLCYREGGCHQRPKNDFLHGKTTSFFSSMNL